MRCIFCKKDSTRSRSVEHVVPESMGNTQWVLRPGIVCDTCNNYFSRKVERPFLDMPAIRQLRFHQEIENKRGKVPPLGGIINSRYPALITRFPRYGLTGIELKSEHFVEISKRRKGTLILPLEEHLPCDIRLSRFLAKVALEAMAGKLSDYPEGIDYICDEAQLDEIRRHARSGEIKEWPVNLRRIYPANANVFNSEGQPEQIVHEEDFLVTTKNEWFFVLAIFGMEMVINLGGPDISGYKEWLEQNNSKSPLYHGKNASSGQLPIWRV